MKKSTIYAVLMALLMPLLSLAQHEQQAIHHPNEKIAPPPIRIALFIGHTLIPEEHAEENFFIPSWGLDIEYWFSRKWGLGLHNDLELETFVIMTENGEMEDLERVSPLVLTFDLLYKPYKGLVLQLGPGLEIEKDENYSLFRAGVEYEFEINHQWDISPTLFYDSRFDGGYHTWSLALGVGRRF